MPPMKKNIAPIVQEITDAQISRIVSRFSERCHKKCALLPRVIVQDILEHEGHVLSKEMFDVLYRHIERRSEMVIRHVKVDRTKTGEQLITALNCKEFVDIEVLATMPTQGKKEENLYFFPVKQIIQVGDYVKEFESRGLVPDPYAQMKA
ncbi:hypothetical protein EXS45_01635, partial [Candidatus Nomurabacteria bacterium]|nr:hypothetical protein [Candidatus Nomurabacteria bacterium]